MDPNDDLWTAIRQVLPGADELATPLRLSRRVGR